LQPDEPRHLDQVLILKGYATIGIGLRPERLVPSVKPDAVTILASSSVYEIRVVGGESPHPILGWKRPTVNDGAEEIDAFGGLHIAANPLVPIILTGGTPVGFDHGRLSVLDPPNTQALLGLVDDYSVESPFHHPVHERYRIRGSLKAPAEQNRMKAIETMFAVRQRGEANSLFRLQANIRFSLQVVAPKVKKVLH
jgi:hypothetical protein